MQLTAKLKNKATVWSALLKVRVLDMVVSSGVYYQNISGINGTLTDPAHWYQWPTSGGGSDPLEINKNAGSISGTDPDFQVDLSADGLPSFPASIRVYISLTGLDADYTTVDAPDYNPVTGILHGMNDPAAFPAQKIKIMVI